MATKHTCDICGNELENRSELWRVEYQPCEKAPAYDSRRYESFELCGACKRRTYVAMMSTTR